MDLNNFDDASRPGLGPSAPVALRRFRRAPLLVVGEDATLAVEPLEAERLDRVLVTLGHPPRPADRRLFERRFERAVRDHVELRREGLDVLPVGVLAGDPPGDQLLVPRLVYIPQRLVFGADLVGVVEQGQQPVRPRPRLRQEHEGRRRRVPLRVDAENDQKEPRPEANHRGTRRPICLPQCFNRGGVADTGDLLPVLPHAGRPPPHVGRAALVRRQRPARLQREPSR